MAFLNRTASRRPSRPLYALVLAGALALSPFAARAQTSSLEVVVKANYLYKFAPFVEWPSRTFPNASSPFTICVLGEDPFGEVLDNTVRGQKIGARPIAVHRAALATPAMGCHIAFAGRSSTQSAPEMLRVLSSQPVLTVTDRNRGVSGAMIQFVLKDGRVRFEIDAASAEASGVTISSKLLGLATSVRRAMR